jgi:magnesium-transporting ATPase (P-type)
MTVIVEDVEGIIHVFTKGADSVIIPLLKDIPE